MRVDLVLWYLRFAKTRPLAQAIAESGHLRRNGLRIDRASHKVAVGDVLVIPLPSGVRVVEILALPARRGPASEAQTCYRPLDAAPALTIAAQASPLLPEGTELP